MPRYILKPKCAKSISEFDVWTNDADERVVTVQHWRSGEFSVVCENKPDIEVGEDGIDLTDYFQTEYEAGNFSHILNDCYYSQIHSCPDNMRRKRRERIDDLWEEQQDLGEDGWYITSTEMWVFCEMTIQLAAE
jgi:hypothetical protein